jgi:hypothetical protein
VTLEEIQDFQHESVDYLHGGDPPIHVIADMTEVTDFPKNVSKVRQVLRYTAGGNLGSVALIIHNTLLRFVAWSVTRLFMPHIGVRVFESVKDGEDYLRSIDPSLAANDQH